MIFKKKKKKGKNKIYPRLFSNFFPRLQFLIVFVSAILRILLSLSPFCFPCSFRSIDLFVIDWHNGSSPIGGFSRLEALAKIKFYNSFPDPNFIFSSVWRKLDLVILVFPYIVQSDVWKRRYSSIFYFPPKLPPLLNKIERTWCLCIFFSK